MRGGFLFSVLFFVVQALAVAARGEEPVAPSAAPSTAPSYELQAAAQGIALTLSTGLHGSTHSRQAFRCRHPQGC